MHTSRDDYLINTLRFVSAKEETQIYGAILHESLTSPEMKETKAYKTYLGFATGATPPKKARKFKKPASPKLSTIQVSTEEPMGKLKRVKRLAMKFTKAPARGVVIRETPKIPLSKKKEKVDVTREVRRKSMREFHKTHPSGSGAVKIIPSVTSEGTGVKLGVPDVTEEESSKNEINITDKAEGDEHEEMGYTTSQLYDDVDIRLNEPLDTDKVFVQEEGTDAAMTNKTEVPVTSSSHSSDLAGKFLNFLDIPHTDAEIVSPMDVYVHHEVPSQQTPTLLTVPVSVIFDSSLVFSTVIPQSLPSFTPPSQQSTSTPTPTTEVTNPPSTLPDFTSVFQFNKRVTSLEKEVVGLKKDPLNTQVTALVDDHLDVRLGSTREEFMNFLSTSLTTRITEQVHNQLPHILPKEVSNFPPPPMIQKMVKESLEDVVLAKESSQPQSLYEAAATLIEFKLKKILIDKMDKSESYLADPEYRECYEGLKKSYDLDKTIFSSYGKVYSLKRSQKDKDEDTFAGSDRGLKKRKTSKDAVPTTGPKAKELQSSSSKGNKSQLKSSGKSVQSEELDFDVVDSI
ncbi:hypothetical protein Tco_0146467 [Tanacetum coccineum]